MNKAGLTVICARAWSNAGMLSFGVIERAVEVMQIPKMRARWITCDRIITTKKLCNTTYMTRREPQLPELILKRDLEELSGGQRG